MATEFNDRLLEHEYDGIREYDNPIPLWLNLILLGTIVFSVFYYAVFQLGPMMGTNGWTIAEAYDEAMAANMRLRFEEIGELQPNESTLIKYLQPENAQWLAVGNTVYKTHCQSCHAPDGSGLVGPNLTDDYYKNVKQLGDIANVLENGAANGAMPAWRNRLHPNEIVLVSAYVASLRGQNLPGPKGAEGQVIAPWPTELSEVPADETTETPSDQSTGATQAPAEESSEES